MKIITDLVYPPIPIRNHDWQACIEGKEEDGPYGYGTTEQEAIEDLTDQLALPLDYPTPIFLQRQAD